MSTACDALWLYGSYARGQADDRSDCDVLALSDSNVSEQGAFKHQGMSDRSLSISRYSWKEFESMAAYGSLFLHHLRLEGRCLYEAPGFEGRLGEILSRLGPYRRARADLQGFRGALADVHESLSYTGSALYEISVLATVVRHASILGCFLLGAPDFGRFSPVVNLVRMRGLDTRIAELFPEIYSCKLLTDGRTVKVKAPTQDTVVEWLRFASTLVNNVGGVINDYERSVSPVYT